MVLITTDLAIPYSLMALGGGELVEEKLTALLTRRKARDYFDLYFILRSRLAVDEVVKVKRELLSLLKKSSDSLEELKLFLPKGMAAVVKDLKKNLVAELERL